MCCLSYGRFSFQFTENFRVLSFTNHFDRFLWFSYHAILWEQHTTNVSSSTRSSRRRVRWSVTFILAFISHTNYSLSVLFVTVLVKWKDGVGGKCRRYTSTLMNIITSTLISRSSLRQGECDDLFQVAIIIHKCTSNSGCSTSSHNLSISYSTLQHTAIFLTLGILSDERMCTK